jgi:hypothetical protein
MTAWHPKPDIELLLAFMIAFGPERTPISFVTNQFVDIVGQTPYQMERQ